MLSLRRMLLVLPLLFLSSRAHTQKPQPGSTSDKAGVPVTAGTGSALPVSQRTTMTFKYTNLYYYNAHLSSPAVTGTFPKGQQAQFIIDTGSDVLVISDELAIKLGLSPEASQRGNTPLVVDGKPAKQVTLPDFVIKLSALSYPLFNAKPLANLTFNGTADVLPEKHVSSTGADGVLGTTFLTSYAAIFDGPKQEATFIVGGKLTQKEREQLGFPASAASVVASPPRVGGSSLVTIPVTLENKAASRQVTLIVDTGSFDTSIPRDDALALGLISVRATISTGAAGTRQFENAPVETLMIGNLAIHGVSASFPSKDNAASQAIGPKGGVTARLGMDVLAGYRVLIDLPASRMYIMPEVPQIKILSR